MSDFYCSHKHYDFKGRHMTIMGRQVGNEIEVFKLTCSKKDTFSKAIGRSVGEAYFRMSLDAFRALYRGYHPEVYKIPVTGDKPKYSFLKHCNDTYYRSKTAFVPIRGQLVQHREWMSRGSIIGMRDKLLIIKYLSK